MVHIINWDNFSKFSCSILIYLNPVHLKLGIQEAQRPEIHADIRAKFNATTRLSRGSKGQAEELDIRSQQRVSLVTLNVITAKLAGPKPFLLC